MHIPVLLQEVLQALNPKPGEFFIDGTLGAGGHTRAFVEKLTPGGTLLAVDRDPRAVAAFKESFTPPSTVTLVAEAASYAKLPELLAKHRLPKADGLLLDLGFSSEQVAGGALAGRGFSFSTDEPLIMTYDDSVSSVAQLLAELSAAELTSIIREYGEERYSAQIAQGIADVAKREGIATTGQLAAAIKKAVPANYERGRLHPATRTFQALRIYANHELEQLEQLLTALPTIVRSGGRAAIISFHSLEDRMVKQYFRQYRLRQGYGAQSRDRAGDSVEGTQITSFPGETPNPGPAPKEQKKPIVASEEEIRQNPRSRSAKLRIITLP